MKALNIDFMSKRRLTLIFSAILILVSIGSFFSRGFVLGIDFTGGTVVEVGYPEAVSLDEIRGVLSDAGFGDAIVQHYGTSKDVLIRLAPQDEGQGGEISNAELSQSILKAVQMQNSEAELRRVEFVGPQIGKELTYKGSMAVLWALIGILIYVAFRFEYRFALGSIAALVHDVTITMGVFSLLGVQFDLTVLAAVLAVIGYSLNDTIVVFDRICENFIRIRKGDAEEVTNTSINQTLSRTLITSMTTLLVVGALLIFGGESIFGFSLALLIGIGVGTYSSIFIASSMALSLGVSKQDLMPPEKEGAELDDMP